MASSDVIGWCNSHHARSAAPTTTHAATSNHVAMVTTPTDPFASALRWRATGRLKASVPAAAPDSAGTEGPIYSPTAVPTSAAIAQNLAKGVR